MEKRVIFNEAEEFLESLKSKPVDINLNCCCGRLETLFDECITTKVSEGVYMLQDINNEALPPVGVDLNRVGNIDLSIENLIILRSDAVELTIHIE